MPLVSPGLFVTGAVSGCEVTLEIEFCPAIALLYLIMKRRSILGFRT